MSDDDIWALIEREPGSPAALRAVAGRVFDAAREAPGIPADLALWIGICIGQIMMGARQDG